LPHSENFSLSHESGVGAGVGDAVNSPQNPPVREPYHLHTPLVSPLPQLLYFTLLHKDTVGEDVGVVSGGPSHLENHAETSRQ
jgi:hypothetical protein